MSQSTSTKRRRHVKLHQPVPISTCPTTRKNGYRGKKRAKTALNHAKSLGAPVTYVYKCRECGAWHLTSSSPRSKTNPKESK